MNLENVVWFIVGALFGWVILFLLVTFGGVALTVIFAMLPIALPVLGLIGLIWMIWYFVSGKNR